MKVVLVNPPRSSYDLSELSPPLGLLRLGTSARNTSADISIIDFNLLWHVDENLRGFSFYKSAVKLLLEQDADVYGFTSMAVDSHVSLKLASLIKQEKAEAVTVFGGAHFSSIANQLLSEFPWVDFIVEGEGERAFECLLEQLSKNTNSVAIPGVRSRHGVSTVGSVGNTFNELPFPDYKLVNLQAYYKLNPKRIFDFEGGRGCRFKCAFCYSPVHYKTVRNFDIEKRIEELYQLKGLGAEHISFVEDNFLNDTSTAIQFCRELEAARLDLTWNCYVTFPQLNTEIISWMARAGCTSLFTGIDAVGDISQKTFHKRFLRSFTALETKLNECTEAGILPTCAFLLSPPSHPCGIDNEKVLKAALIARNSGALVRLNTLTLYNGTISQSLSVTRIVADNLKPRLLLDVPNVVERNDYAHNNPELFPFHSRYVSQKEWSQFLHLVHCLFTLYFCFPNTLDMLWEEVGLNPAAIANTVIEKIGNLTRVDKRYRRHKELEIALSVLKKLTKVREASRVFDLEEAALRAA